MDVIPRLYQIAQNRGFESGRLGLRALCIYAAGIHAPHTKLTLISRQQPAAGASPFGNNSPELTPLNREIWRKQ